MNDEQLARLFFRLLKTVPVVELHHAVVYAVTPPNPMAREPRDPAAEMSRSIAAQMVEHVKVAGAYSGPPTFPPRR